MFSKYIPKRYANAFLKHIIGVTVFFPYVYSKQGYMLYPDFILANFFVVLTILAIIASWKIDFRRNLVPVCITGTLLLVYNIFFTYVNATYHHWYGEQINVTITFILFIVLLLVKNPHSLLDKDTIRSFIHMMVVSNIVSILYRLITSKNQVYIINNIFLLSEFGNGMEDQYPWIYFHKSQYALILVLCIAFCVVYRTVFRNIFTYLLTLAVLFFALYLSDTYTSMAAALLIFVGQLLDYLCKANIWKKLGAALIFVIGMLAVIPKFISILSSERDILSLGGRRYIWPAAWEFVKENPNGLINEVFSTVKFPVEMGDGSIIYANNCHNIFMNHMLRYSIVVGCLFIALFVMLFVLSLLKHFSFLTLFTWIALVIPMNMDHSLTTVELSLFIILIYCMFFREKKFDDIPVKFCKRIKQLILAIKRK